MRGHRTFWILVLALLFVLLGLTADAGEPVARYSLTNGWATFGLVVPQGAAKTGRSERSRARRARAHVLRHGELAGSWGLHVRNADGRCRRSISRARDITGSIPAV
jgi:hypothetical protein